LTFHHKAKTAATRKKEYAKFPEDESLSPRELEVLDLIVKGLSNNEIADLKCISRDTVKSHVSKILRKLSASDRTHAAVKALREGLVV
jgi:DNA-binding NarL/FixJ family response regulator